jgi:hypothetical protein
MAKYETVSVKVPVELKEKIRKLRIKTGDVLRKALEEEVRRREVEEINRELKELHPVLQKIKIEDVVASIREDRDRR